MTTYQDAIISAIRGAGGCATQREIEDWITVNTDLFDNHSSISNTLNQQLRYYCKNCIRSEKNQYISPDLFYRHQTKPFTYSLVNDDIVDNLVTTSVPAPPRENNGWNAEMFVRHFLIGEKWQTSYVGHMKLGYDIKAEKSGRILCVEVKSSVGECSPTLTKNEYNKLQDDDCDFVLAILENFDPKTSNEINWIENSKLKRIYNSKYEPAYTCSYYPLSRTAWVKEADSFTSISKPSIFDF
jgi:hypothetical protein